jgi:hypothetical protein
MACQESRITGTNGMGEVREALSVIEAEIVGALRQLKRLERERVPATSPEEQAAIVHLGEALHEIQQARAHCRLEEAIRETPPLHFQPSVPRVEAI